MQAARSRPPTANSPDGKFRVHLVTAFQKYRADSKGEQREVSPNDWINIGVLDSKGQYLYLQKQKIDRATMEFGLTWTRYQRRPESTP